LRENRAIVTDIPGTTRDIIEEYVNIDGIPLKIIDTAGIRETESIVEQIGVDRARDMVNQADLVIAIFDASESLTDEDFHIIEIIKDKETIVLLNKLDLPNEYDEEYLQELIPNKEIITTSIATGIGVDKLENSIKEMFYAGEINMESDTIVTNMRHKNQLIKARENIIDAIDGIKMDVPLDCIEVDIKNCWDNLGEITGDNIGEDILDKIFSEFCIGK
ncbi:MAG: GTP-binding protein, partial [Tissierellia bacterium]|nr:GTP-binding protein [Tissierellia bacterium]